MSKLETIEGLGPVYAEKLAASGVENVADLLAKGGTAAGIASLAEATGISEKLIQKWVIRADLSRVHGVSEEYADLLAYAGIASTAVLAAHDDATALADAMREVNDDKALVRRVPSADTVAKWIASAQAIGGAAIE